MSDWDAGTENAYEEHRAKHRAWDEECSCRRHGWDPDCPQHGRHGIEASGAYELDDPKHETFHERYADLADMDTAA